MWFVPGKTDYIGLDFTGKHGRPHIDIRGKFADYVNKTYKLGGGRKRLDLFADGFLEGLL